MMGVKRGTTGSVVASGRGLGAVWPEFSRYCPETEVSRRGTQVLVDGAPSQAVANNSAQKLGIVFFDRFNGLSQVRRKLQD
ncbi:MAG: hypothetical protein V3U67_03205 [Gemmatimonadota bacterium]